MRTTHLILYMFIMYVPCISGQEKAKNNKNPSSDTLTASQAMVAYHQSLNSMQTMSVASTSRKYDDVLMAGPMEGVLQYFYVDTKIPFTSGAAPQVQITGYGYMNSNKATKLTLGWYHWAGTWYWTQYRCDLGYYNPSRIRLGTYNDAGTTRVRIEIANDVAYWTSFSFSATDHQGDASYYEGWTYKEGQMPTGTGNITTVGEYGFVNIGSAASPVTLTVAGDIRAREVKVEANAGADFVFAPDYRLRSLPEVEQFIAANRHLPDIAPADSMVQNGVDVGEMQVKLLQKVEELTLYVIEQGKQNEALKQQVQAQQKEIEQLKNTKYK